MNVELQRSGLLPLALPLYPNQARSAIRSAPSYEAVRPPHRPCELHILQAKVPVTGPLLYRLAERGLSHFLKALHQLGP